MQTCSADVALNSFVEESSIHQAIAQLYGCRLGWVGLEEGVYLKVVLYRPRPTCSCDRPECSGSNNSVERLGSDWNAVLKLQTGHLTEWVFQLVRPVSIVDAQGAVLDKREPPEMVRQMLSFAAASVTRHICIQLLTQPGLLPAALPDSAVANILHVCRNTVGCPLLYRLVILPFTGTDFAQACKDESLAAARLVIHSPPAVYTDPQGSTTASSMAALLFSMDFLQPGRAGRQEVVAALHRVLQAAGWPGPQADAAHLSAGLSSPPGTAAGRLDLPRDLEEVVAAALLKQWALHLDAVVAAAACSTAASARHTAVCVLCGQRSSAQLVRCRNCVHSYHIRCVNTGLYSPDLQQLQPAPGGDSGLCLCCQNFPIREEVQQRWLQCFEKARQVFGHTPAGSPEPCQQLLRTCGGDGTSHVQQAPTQQVPCLLVHSQTDLAPAGMHHSHDIIIPSSQSDEEKLHLGLAAPAGPHQPASAGPGPLAPPQQWQLHPTSTLQPADKTAAGAGQVAPAAAPATTWALGACASPARAPSTCLVTPAGGGGDGRRSSGSPQVMPAHLLAVSTDAAGVQQVEEGQQQQHVFTAPASRSFLGRTYHEELRMMLSLSCAADRAEGAAAADPRPLLAEGERWCGPGLTAEQSSQHQQRQAVQPAHQAEICTATSSLPTPDVGQQQQQALGSAGGTTHMQHRAMPYAGVSVAHVHAPQQHMLQLQGQMQQLVSQGSSVVPCSAVHHQLHKLLPHPSPDTQGPMHAHNLQIAGALLLLFLPLSDAEGSNAWDRSVQLLQQGIGLAECVVGLQHKLQSLSWHVPAGAALEVVAPSAFGHGVWGPAPGLVWDWDAVTAAVLEALVSLLRAELASCGTNMPVVCVQLHLQCFCRLWSTGANTELEHASLRRRLMLGILVQTSRRMAPLRQLVNAAAGPSAPWALDHREACEGSQLGAGCSLDCGSRAATSSLPDSHPLQLLPADVAAAVTTWGEAPGALAAAIRLLGEQRRVGSALKTCTSSLDGGSQHTLGLGKGIVLEVQQLLAHVLCRPCNRHMLLQAAWDYTLLLVVVEVAAAASPSLLDDPCMWSALVADGACAIQPLSSSTAELSSTIRTFQPHWAAVAQEQCIQFVEQLVTLFASHIGLTCLVLVSQQGSASQQQQLDCGAVVLHDRQLACTSLPKVCSSATTACCAIALSAQRPPDCCSTGLAPQDVVGQCMQCLFSIVATITAAYNLLLLPDDQLLQQGSFVSFGSRFLTDFVTERCEVAIEHLKAGDCMAATGAFLDLKERLGHRHISMPPDSFPFSQV